MARPEQTSDIFVSYATEDAGLCANDLIMALFEVGVTSMWVDRLVIKHGESIPKRVDEGLRKTRHLLPIVTPNYFNKPWTQMELDAVRMLSKPALPIWVNVDAKAVKAFSPTLAAQKALIYANNPYEIAEIIAANLLRNKRTHFYKAKDKRYSATVFWQSVWAYVLITVQGQDFLTSDFVQKLGPDDPDKQCFLKDIQEAIRLAPEDIQARTTAFRKAAGELGNKITDEDIAHIIVGYAKRQGESFAYEPRENEALKLIGVKHWGADGFFDMPRGRRKMAEELRNTKAPPINSIQLSVRGAAYTTQYRGAVVEINLANQTSVPKQIISCSLTIPSLGIVLDHSPGPPNLIGGAPWLARAPFEIPARRLTRGSLFFPAGPRLPDGLPSGPVAATLSLDFYMGTRLEQEIEILTFDELRAREAALADHVAPRQTPAEKLRAAAERRQKEQTAQEDSTKRYEIFQQAALQQAPEAFNALAELLRTQGEELNSHNIPGVPVLKYVAVNHRLDAGATYAIELSPYQQQHSYTATVRVGLHPNAAQSHAELPLVETSTLELQASMDETGFSWIDKQGKKWLPSDIIDAALDSLTELLTTPPRFEDD